MSISAPTADRLLETWHALNAALGYWKQHFAATSGTARADAVASTTIDLVRGARELTEILIPVVEPLHQDRYQESARACRHRDMTSPGSAPH